MLTYDSCSLLHYMQVKMKAIYLLRIYPDLKYCNYFNILAFPKRILYGTRRIKLRRMLIKTPWKCYVIIKGSAGLGYLELIKWVNANYPHYGSYKTSAIYYAGINKHMNIVKYLTNVNL